jgi:o-succinylbenzoate synthase
MRIDGIDLYRVAMPLISPWRTAYGEDAVIESVLVKMVSGEVSGWGETSPLSSPSYSPEYAAGVFYVLKTWLAPAIIGLDIHHASEMSQVFRHIKGNQFAKAGLDLAWWDLSARLLGQPLYRALGSDNRKVRVGADFGVGDSVEALLQEIGDALDAGLPRVKLKFRPGWDLPVVRAVRKAFPELVMHVDCNSAYRLTDLAMFEELDELKLAMIEQPLAHDDVVDHAALQRRIRTPICLDESVSGPDRARQAIELGSCQYINVKPGRVGGLTSALAIHDLCRQAGVGCWVGGMLESALGVSHSIALATLPGFTYPADIFPSSQFYRADLGKPEIRLSAAAEVQAAECPGIGVIPDGSRLAACTLDHVSLMARRGG